MVSLKLTPPVAGQRSTDLDRTNNRSTLIRGDDEIAQRIRVTLQEQFGASLYNKNGGTPYKEYRERSDLDIRAMLVAVISNVTGVADVPTCYVESTTVAGDRVAVVNGTARTESGAIIPFATEVR